MFTFVSHKRGLIFIFILNVMILNIFSLPGRRNIATFTKFKVSCTFCQFRAWWCTVYPKKYAHGFVVLCFVVVTQSFIMNSHEVFIHIHQGCFAGTGAIVRLPQCQWSKPDGYGKISQCITTTKHSKAKTVFIFLGIYCWSKWKKHLTLPTLAVMCNKWGKKP